jgi:hypothetical protein
MSSNPMNILRNFINTSADTISQTYEKVSAEVSDLVTPVVQNVKSIVQVERVEPEQPIKPIKPIKQEQNDIELNPFEKKFESMYVGCYSDDPNNPTMKNFLGQVSNISECIDLGKTNKYEYVGIRGGNECFASNTIPTTQTYDRTKYCNVGCNDVGTGNCGGFFYNQVYKTTFPNLPDSTNNYNLESEVKTDTDLNNSTTEAIDILENFISSNTDMNKISMGLNKEYFNCWKPLNTCVIFYWLIILLFLIYLLFEYLNRENTI